MNVEANNPQPPIHNPHSQQKKPELLSPAGDLESFFVAVENGADAVYFGLKDFSARAGAQNLTLDDTSKAIAYAHKRSIKVYVAFNTLIKSDELKEAVDYLVALEELQPDALILQDIGLLYLIQQRFPQFNLYASTQMTIHNLAGVRQLGKMGFKRVVLARELSIGEINTISRNTAVEIEVFVHGALCYSYSGLCLFSSMIGGRSGNRGRCAQPCRMYYKSQSDKGGYLFSMKDLRTLSHINKLMRAGVRSFKIEGRMKSPEYVAVVTHVYRQAIDGKLEDMDDAIHLMNTVFSREATHSYLFEESCQRTNKQVKAANMINPSYPANIGSYAGEIIKSQKGCVTIRADTNIGVRDLLQVFGDISEEPTLLHVKNIQIKGKRVFGIKTGDTAMVDTERQYRQGAKLYLLSSQKVKEMFAPKVPKKLEVSKIPVDLEIKISPDRVGIKGITKHFSFFRDYHVNLEKGIHKTTEAENIKECFTRLGNTPFELAGIHGEISGELFVPLSVLNEIRRDYFQIFCEEWRRDRDRRCGNIKKWIKEKFIECSNSKSKVSSGNISEEEIRLSLKIDKLSYLNYIPLEKVCRIYIVLTDETIKNLTKNNGSISTPMYRNLKLSNAEMPHSVSKVKDKIIFSLPTIMRDTGNGDMSFGYFKKVVHELISQDFRQFQLSNLGARELFDDEDVQLYADYPFYCLNLLSAMKLRELGFCRHTLSPEADKDNVQTLFASDADVIVYQDTPLFTSETCIWANMKKMCPGRNRCGFEQAIVENEHGDCFIAMNEACKTVVIGEKPFSIIHFIPKLLEAGQKDFRIDLCCRDYTPEMIENIFSAIQDKRKIKNSIVGNFERGLI